jgi:hypothetical protein
MSDRYESRAALASKIEWEGGLMEALDYGIKTSQMPEGDEELAGAWNRLATAYHELAPLADAVEALLPGPDDEEDGDD